MTGRSTTERGFTIYDEFTDTCDQPVRVQESSIATGDRVWIFTGHPGEDGSGAHLDIEQAKRVRDALDAFISENQPLCRAHPDDCPNGPEPHAYYNPPEFEGRMCCCRQPGDDKEPQP